jgi:hypothetical protein
MVGAKLYMTSGDNAGLARTITARSGTTLTVSAFPSTIASGDRYSISPIPFGVRLWPLKDITAQGTELFRRWVKHSGFVANDNDKWRVGVYRNGSENLWERRTVAYTSGGTYEIKEGDIIEGATSEATAVVASITVTSGTWAGGTAAGTITIHNQSGTFQSENLNVLANSNVATIAANSVYASGGTVEITVNDNPADSAEALNVDGIEIEPYIEQIATGVSFELTDVEINATITGSRDVEG